MKPKSTINRESTHEEIMEKARRYGIKFIDLKIDFAFKFVFGTQGKEDLLLNLIDSILPDKHIVSVALGPQEQMPDNPEKRRSIYDIHCTTESGTHITVEMQYAKQSDFNNRMVYYSSYTLRNSLKRGDEGFEYPELYVIGILDFLLPGVKENPEVVDKRQQCPLVAYVCDYLFGEIRFVFGFSVEQTRLIFVVHFRDPILDACERLFYYYITASKACQYPVPPSNTGKSGIPVEEMKNRFTFS